MVCYTKFAAMLGPNKIKRHVRALDNLGLNISFD